MVLIGDEFVVVVVVFGIVVAFVVVVEVCSCVCVCLCVYVCLCVGMFLCWRVYVFACVCACLYVCVFMRVRVRAYGPNERSRGDKRCVEVVVGC